MVADLPQFYRVARRLSEAAGYLELGMPLQALQTLQNLGPLGPLEAEVEFLRGHALRMQHRYPEAARRFRLAAQKLPSPQDKTAWLALSACYREAGNTLKAIQMLARARGANRPGRL